MRLRALLVVLAVGLAGLLGLPTPAFADAILCSGNSYSTCINKGYTAHGFENNYTKSYWRAYAGHNCTNYAGYMMTLAGAPTPNMAMGDGGAWDSSARTLGYPVDGTPAVGSIAQWEPTAGMGSSGHVAYVEAVTSTTITVSEDIYSAGPFRWRQISKGSAMWPSNFLHFKDAAPSSSVGIGTRLLGDVNGDGKQDAVVMFKDSGKAMVALAQSNGSFGGPASWSSGHSMQASKYFLADVQGDGKADLIAFFADSGSWKVSLSSGSGFWAPTDWASGHGVGTSKQWVLDVTGDRKADVVTFDSANGDWWVSASSGSGFWAPVRWISGHGVGSTSQEVADFTGDGKADAGIWISGNGSWYVAASRGSDFAGPPQWSNGHGLSSDKRLVGDVNGDGRADVAYFFTSNGHWDVGQSSGSGFWAPTAWAHGHGVGTSEQFLSDVTGDRRADVVTFDSANGDWWVSASSGSGFWAPVRWISGHGANS